jgi:hypothetical protein
MATRTIVRDTDRPSNELIYYNLDIVNSNTLDSGSGTDPVVKFEDTRSTTLLKDASKYNFSIVRFNLNGPNKDLPLFIPIMQTQQSAFSVSRDTPITCSLYVTNSTGTISGTVPIPTGNYSALTFLSILNLALATAANASPLTGLLNGVPVASFNSSGYLQITLPPATTQTSGSVGITTNTNFANLTGFTTNGGNGSSGINYFVSLSGGIITAPAAISTSAPYNTIYSVTITGKVGTATYTAQKYVQWWPESTDVPVPQLSNGILTQSLNNRYWWCYTYKHWLDCVNRAFSDCITQIGTLANATIITLAPFITYNSNGLFSIAFDSNGFGDNTLAGTFPVINPINQDQRLSWSSQNENFQLYFNSNMFGLFTNFNNYYIGADNTTAPDYGRDNLIVCTNEQTATYNPLVVDPGKPGLPSAVVTSSALTPTAWPRTLFITTQNYASTSSLWSPISSIVFCSTLLPTLSENTSAPNILGSGDNTLQNTTTNAFSPIITDIALSMSSASDWRQFISYTPTSEYRLTSMGTSDVDVRNIDIQVFWKARLTGELFPINMFNQSSVSMKVLFRLRNGGK